MGAKSALAWSPLPRLSSHPHRRVMETPLCQDVTASPSSDPRRFGNVTLSPIPRGSCLCVCVCLCIYVSIYIKEQMVGWLFPISFFMISHLLLPIRKNKYEVSITLLGWDAQGLAKIPTRLSFHPCHLKKCCLSESDHRHPNGALCQMLRLKSAEDL